MLVEAEVIPGRLDMDAFQYDYQFDRLLLATVNHHLATASVFSPDGSLAGVKSISHSNGSFLPPPRFAVESLAGPGNYQNGAYWPLFTQVELALAFAISGDDKFREVMEQLMVQELSDGKAK